MNAVGIDVSKGKSMVAILRPFGKIVFSPLKSNIQLGHLITYVTHHLHERRVPDRNGAYWML